MCAFSHVMAVVMAVVGAFSAFSAPVAIFAGQEPPGNGIIPLTLFHVNDWHGNTQPVPVSWIDKENPPRLGGPAHLASALHQFKLEALKGGSRYLFLDSGDRFQGTLEVNLSSGAMMIDLWNHLKCTIGAVGNHDFDYGPEVFRHSSRTYRFPQLCANLDGWPGLWRPAVRTTVNGVRLGVFALMTEELPTVCLPSVIAGLSVRPMIPAARAQVEALRRAGCELIVLLSHCGHDADRDIARQVPGIDLIFGGHTNHHLETPIREGDSLIFQTYGYGTHLGVLHLAVNNTDASSPRIASFSYRNLPLDPDRFPADPEVAALLASFARGIEEMTMAPVTTLPHSYLRAETTGPQNLGTLVTQAIQEKTGVDVAVFHRGGIRADLPGGRIRWKDVYQTFPFDHQVVVGEVSGKDLLGLLSHPKRAILCFSGLGFDGTTFAGVDPQKTYRIAYNNFLEGGGEGFVEFSRLRSDGREYGIVRNLFLEFLRSTFKAPD
jgi:5'-nucleotidase